MMFSISSMVPTEDDPEFISIILGHQNLDVHGLEQKVFLLSIRMYSQFSILASILSITSPKGSP